jgi:hypothetical protein
MNLANFFTNSQHTDTPPKGTGGGSEQQQQQAQERKTAEEQRDEEIAARLYGKKPAQEQQQTEQQKSGEQKPKDAEDVARSLYSSDSTYADTVLVADGHPEATAEQIAAANADARAQFKAMELPAMMAKQMTETFNASMRTPLSDAEYDKRVANFQHELTRQFGSEAQERLADVRKLLAKADPAVTAALIESGMNYDIQVIRELADHARSLKGRGRL